MMIHSIYRWESEREAEWDRTVYDVVAAGSVAQREDREPREGVAQRWLGI